MVMNCLASLCCLRTDVNLMDLGDFTAGLGFNWAEEYFVIVGLRSLGPFTNQW